MQPKSASYVVNQTRGISEIVTELYDTLVNKHYNLEPYYGDNPSKLQELIKEKYQEIPRGDGLIMSYIDKQISKLSKYNKHYIIKIVIAEALLCNMDNRLYHTQHKFQIGNKLIPHFREHPMNVTFKDMWNEATLPPVEHKERRAFNLE